MPLGPSIGQVADVVLIDVGDEQVVHMRSSEARSDEGAGPPACRLVISAVDHRQRCANRSLDHGTRTMLHVKYSNNCCHLQPRCPQRRCLVFDFLNQHIHYKALAVIAGSS